MESRNRAGKHYKVKSKSKVKSKKHIFLVLLVVCISIVAININSMIAYFSSTDTITNEFTIQAEYTVAFNSNGGTGTMQNQTISYNVPTNLSTNTFAKSEFIFNGWNTKADGTGTHYNNEEVVTNLIGENDETVTLYAQWLMANIVAEIDGTYYSSLQKAVDAVPENNTETTIKLLKNTSENIKVAANKNIVFNFQDFTLSDPGTGCVIENSGTLKIINGTVRSLSTTDGAVNNLSTGNLTISGGRIMMAVSRGKQALYNDKGIVHITGGYFSSLSTSRATVQNIAGGTLTITGGTIVAEGTQAALNNAGTMTIGTKDGSVDVSSPVFQGATYGITSSTNYNFYDGIAKGKTGGIDNKTKVADKEEDYQIATSEETINNQNYKTAYLAETVTVTFNANGGSVSETTRNVENGKRIGTLPTPTMLGYVFEGWFTSEEDGEQITADTIITGDVTYYAHWKQVAVAEIDGTQYFSLKQAVEAAPKDDTVTTIKLLRDTSDNFKVKSGQNIIFNLQNYTLTNGIGAVLIENEGTVTIYNGTISSTAEFATINNNEGAVLKISGGNILAEKRPAVYNNNGIVEISGGYLYSKATGRANTTVLDRAAVQNLPNGTITITGGTIVGAKQQGVASEGTLIIGSAQDGINTSSPDIRGEIYGVESIGTLEIYDGIIKGATDAISGTVTDQEPNSQIVNGTVTEDGKTYITAYLENE